VFQKNEPNVPIKKVRFILRTIFILASFSLIILSQIGFAVPKIDGDWCEEKYDRFRTVMTIYDTGELKRTIKDQERGDSAQPEMGFISVGGSHIELKLSGEPVLATNVEVSTDQKTLYIDYLKRSNEVFSRCTIVWQ